MAKEHLLNLLCNIMYIRLTKRKIQGVFVNVSIHLICRCKLLIHAIPLSIYYCQFNHAIGKLAFKSEDCQYVHSLPLGDLFLLILYNRRLILSHYLKQGNNPDLQFDPVQSIRYISESWHYEFLPRP